MEILNNCYGGPCSSLKPVLVDPKANIDIKGYTSNLCKKNVRAIQ